MYEEITPEFLKNEMLSRMDTEISTIEGSFASDMVSAVAYQFYNLWQEMDSLYGLMFFSGLYGEYLDERCMEYGLLRTPGTKARGTMLVTTRFETTIPPGTLFATSSGNIYIAKESAATQDGCTVIIEAENIGEKYNALQTENIVPVLPIPGITSVSLSSDISGGSDAETDDSLRERLYAHIKAAGSGCVNDYITWAKEVPGVGSVNVLPTWAGAGTVKVVVSDASFTGADDELIERVAEHIEEKRPIGAQVTVSALSPVGIHITANVTLKDSGLAELVKTEFETELRKYCKKAAEERDRIIFLSRIGALLMGISGVQDYSDIFINGNAENLVLGIEEMPVFEGVTLNA